MIDLIWRILTFLGKASVTLDTLLLLEHAARYDAHREEEHTQGYASRGVVVLHCATTVGTVTSENSLVIV